MKPSPIVSRIIVASALLGSGSMPLAVAPGCDDDVRGILVDGLELASLTAVEALFQRVRPDTEVPTTSTTTTGSSTTGGTSGGSTGGTSGSTPIDQGTTPSVPVLTP